MAEIWLAGNLIENLAWWEYGHLQLVYVSGATQIENEVQSPWNITLGNWVFETLRDHTDTDNTSNYGVAGEYAYITLNLGSGPIDHLLAA